MTIEEAKELIKALKAKAGGKESLAYKLAEEYEAKLKSYEKLLDADDRGDILKLIQELYTKVEKTTADKYNKEFFNDIDTQLQIIKSREAKLENEGAKKEVKYQLDLLGILISKVDDEYFENATRAIINKIKYTEDYNEKVHKEVEHSKKDVKDSHIFLDAIFKTLGVSLELANYAELIKEADQLIAKKDKKVIKDLDEDARIDFNLDIIHHKGKEGDWKEQNKERRTYKFILPICFKKVEIENQEGWILDLDKTKSKASKETHAGKFAISAEPVVTEEYKTKKSSDEITSHIRYTLNLTRSEGAYNKLNGKKIIEKTLDEIAKQISEYLPYTKDTIPEDLSTLPDEVTGALGTNPSDADVIAEIKAYNKRLLDSKYENYSLEAGKIIIGDGDEDEGSIEEVTKKEATAEYVIEFKLISKATENPTIIIEETKPQLNTLEIKKRHKYHANFEERKTDFLSAFPSALK